MGVGVGVGGGGVAFIAAYSLIRVSTVIKYKLRHAPDYGDP